MPTCCDESVCEIPSHIPVNVIVVGDEGTGKTSLINAFLTTHGHETDALPKRFPRFKLPPNHSSIAYFYHSEEIEDCTNGRTLSSSIAPIKLPVAMTINDCSGLIKADQLESEVKEADVIVLVYDQADQLEGTGRGELVPIILVHSKCDDREVNPGEEDLCIQSLMSQYLSIETAIRCSMRADSWNIPEIFWFAQKAALFPVGPLLDPKNPDSLSAEVKEALTRIFAIVDQDGDGKLSDKGSGDLTQLATYCHFKEPLEVGLDPVSLDAFLYAMRLLIDRGRQEVVWNLLRRFGHRHAPGNHFSTPLMRFDACSTYSSDHDLYSSTLVYEPTGKVIKYLVTLFRRFDRDLDGHLSSVEQQHMFSTLLAEGQQNPWLPLGFPDCCICDPDGRVSLDSYLSLWMLLCSVDPGRFSVLMRMFGFGYISEAEGKAAEKASTVRVFTIDSGADAKQRHVFRIQLRGPSGAGKTSLAQSFLKKQIQEDTFVLAKLQPYPRYYVRSIEHQGQALYLILIDGHGSNLSLIDGELWVLNGTTVTDGLTFIEGLDKHPNGMLVISKIDLLENEAINANSASSLWSFSDDQAINKLCGTQGWPPAIPFSAFSPDNSDVWPMLTLHFRKQAINRGALVDTRRTLFGWAKWLGMIGAVAAAIGAIIYFNQRQRKLGGNY